MGFHPAERERLKIRLKMNSTVFCTFDESRRPFFHTSAAASGEPLPRWSLLPYCCLPLKRDSPSRVQRSALSKRTATFPHSAHRVLDCALANSWLPLPH